jgi:uncharacterized protein
MMDPVFDPLGSDWTSVSPVLATMRRIILAGAAGVLAVAGSLAGGLLVGWWVPAAVVVAVLVAVGWAWWVIGRNRAAWGYTERHDDLLVRRGVMFRQLVVVPYGRMQFVDVKRGPVERFFGLATVQLHTAAAATDARIPGLLPEEAARLRDRLAARGESRAAGV